MEEDYFFFYKDNDLLDKDIENDSILEDILREKNGSLRIFLSQKERFCSVFIIYCLPKQFPASPSLSSTFLS